eukprot:NODE_1184_length_1216_cov_322.510767.p1 GENE.NODE_1184_length_1216_cov_322.510767~~NODE_1184_length_1216_cov_322.510767.p1  ORF type:complete len:314 (+),score=55.53 NODE_1184_length_1216_cov_322.510767:30-971(+)
MLRERVKNADRNSIKATQFWALVANDGTKAMLRDFVSNYQDIVSEMRLCGTGTTSSMLMSVFGLPVDCVFASGPLGGDQELAALIVEGKVEGVIFFFDALSSHAHMHDILSLIRICDVHHVLLCLTYRTAAGVVVAHHTRRGHLVTPSRKSRRGSIDFLEKAAPHEDSIEQHAAQRGLPLRLAIVAHDSMLPLVCDMLTRHVGWLRNHELTSMPEISRLLHNNFGLTVRHEIPTALMGGGRVLGSMIVKKQIDAVFMLQDPLACQQTFDDVPSLLRLCVTHQVYWSTNLRTGIALLEFFVLEQAIRVKSQDPS